MRCEHLVFLNICALAAGVPTCNAEDTSVARLEISAAAKTSLHLALFLENAEVGILSNISTQSDGDLTNETLHVFQEIQKDDASHRDALQRILTAAGEIPVQPCEYMLPRDGANDFLSTARALKSIAVDALLGVAESVAATDPGLLTGFLSVAATEARHSAVLERVDEKPFSSHPFETVLPQTWAYNLALDFVVRGSCPDAPPLPVLPTLLSRPVGGEVSFSWNAEETAVARQGDKPLFIAWVGQIGVPMYTPLTISTDGNGTVVKPKELTGTAFAVLTSQSDAQTVSELEGYTLAGPVHIFLGVYR